MACAVLIFLSLTPALTRQSNIVASLSYGRIESKKPNRMEEKQRKNGIYALREILGEKFAVIVNSRWHSVCAVRAHPNEMKQRWTRRRKKAIWNRNRFHLNPAKHSIHTNITSCHTSRPQIYYSNSIYFKMSENWTLNDMRRNANCFLRKVTIHSSSSTHAATTWTPDGNVMNPIKLLKFEFDERKQKNLCREYVVFVFVRFVEIRWKCDARETKERKKCFGKSVWWVRYSMNEQNCGAQWIWKQKDLVVGLGNRWERRLVGFIHAIVLTRIINETW